MVLPRVLTALIAAPLFLWALYLGSIPFMIFMFLLILLALWEFHRMAEAGGYATQSWWGIAGGMVLTRASSAGSLDEELGTQLLRGRNTLWIACGVLLGLATTAHGSVISPVVVDKQPL